jgi:hypothetical protein
VLVPIIAAVLVLAAGAGAGAYFFIFNGSTDDGTHASPDTAGISELSDVSKDLQEKLAPEDQVSDTPVIEEPVDNCGPSGVVTNADGTVENCAIIEPIVTDDTDMTDSTTDTTTQPVKRVKRGGTTEEDNTPPILGSPEKARDIQRISDLQKIAGVLTVMTINGTLPDTNCTANIGLNSQDFGGRVPADPKNSGYKDSTIDCSSSYYYVHFDSEMTMGIYGKLETPTGNISCDMVGKQEIKVTDGEEAYCYAILVQ